MFSLLTSIIPMTGPQKKPQRHEPIPLFDRYRVENNRLRDIQAEELRARKRWMSNVGRW